MDSATRGKSLDGNDPRARRNPAWRRAQSLRVAGSSHSGGGHGSLNAPTTTAGRDISYKTATDNQKNPVTSNISINLYPQPSSHSGASESKAIQESGERCPPSVTGVPSGEGGMNKEIDDIQEVERLKNEVKQLKNRCSALETENNRLKYESVQLTRTIKDETSKTAEKEAELVKRCKLVKSYERRDWIATKSQENAADIRDQYIEELHSRHEEIQKLRVENKELKEQCQALREDKHKSEEESKVAKYHIRHAQLTTRIKRGEKSVADLGAKLVEIREQRQRASDTSNGSNKSKGMKDAEARIDKLDNERKVMRAALTKEELRLDAFRAELEAMTNQIILPGDLDPDSSHGSYDSHYEPVPGLTKDISSRASRSPPQTDASLSLEKFITSEDTPWAKTVVSSNGPSSRRSDSPSRAAVVGARPRK